MKDIIKKVPIPICGVMLGTAALGNLLQSYSDGIRYFCGVMAAILLILILLKLILFPDMIKDDMKNPIMASVSGTFPMAVMLLSTYIKPIPFIGQAAFVIWLFAILLHVVLIIYFTFKFILKLQMPKVFASYFIVYVGIAVAAVTAPTYEQTGIGTVAFWFGLVTFVLLFVLITIRYIKYKAVPEPAKPLLCIYTAPLSLCIAGYVQSVTPKSFTFLVAMLAVATVLYIFALIKMLGYLKLPFYPSYAAFTFPFVISAIAAKQTMACATKLGTPIAGLSVLVMIETIIAVVLVVYTYVRFVLFLAPKKQK
jgi:exfoliative toxin A/B